MTTSWWEKYPTAEPVKNWWEKYPARKAPKPVTPEEKERAAEMSRLLLTATEPAPAVSTAVEMPMTRVQRILDDAEESRQLAGIQEKPELAIKAPTPDEQIDEENERYYNAQAELGYGMGAMGGRPAGGFMAKATAPEPKELEEATPQEVVQAQLYLEISELVSEKGVHGAKKYLKDTGMLQKEPIVERFFNAVVGKEEGIPEDLLLTGPERIATDLAGVLAGFYLPIKIVGAAGVTGRTALQLRRARLPEKLAEMGGRAAGMGATFGLRGAQEAVAQEMAPEDAAKHITNHTIFGAGLGGALAMPNKAIRVPATAMYGYLVKRLEGANQVDAALTGAVFMFLGLMTRRDISFEVKDAIAGRMMKKLDTVLTRNGISPEISRSIQSEMYRRYAGKVNPTLDDFIKLEDDLAALVRKEGRYAEALKELPLGKAEPVAPGKEVVPRIAEKPSLRPAEALKPEIRPKAPVEPVKPPEAAVAKATGPLFATGKGRFADQTILDPRRADEMPALQAITGVSAAKDYPGLLEGVKWGRTSTNPIGSYDIVSRDKAAKQDYDDMDVGELPQPFIEKYGAESVIDRSTGRFDFDKLAELAESELRDVVFAQGEFVKEARVPEKIKPSEAIAVPEKVTAELADVGPDIIHEQELRQAFPTAEASPVEPPGQFAKDIKPRKDIGADLMEAARILAAPARYKKLRGSMIGVFRKPDKIELKDIRWIRTLAHELGHAVDYRLTKYPSSILKRFPDLGVSEYKARDELKRASEYFRPLPEGAKWDNKTSLMRYRAKHTELMADLVGLYTINPKKARELAPNVTEALGRAIAASGDVREAIRTVLEPEAVKSIELRGRETTTELPPKPEIVGTEADPQIRSESIELVKLTSRELETQLVRTFAFGKKGRTSLREKDRELLTFLVEKTGDPRIKGDTFEKVQARATPEIRKLVRELRYETELNRQEANKIFEEAGDGPEYIRYLADYISHFWVVSRKKALEYAGRWRKTTPHAKQRKFPTFAEGVALGWEPISYDAIYLYERAAENNFRAAVTRRFARRIKDMRTTGGDPVMVGSLDKAGADWVKIDHPVLRHVYAYKAKDGSLILGEGNAYVHPSIARPVKVLLEKPFRGPISKVIYAINAAGKSINVAFSFFHEFSLFESSQAVNARFLNPLRGIFIGPFEARRLGIGFRPHLTHRAGFLLMEKDIYGFADAASVGLAIRRSPATIDYARTYLESKLRLLEAKTRKVPALSFTTKTIRQGYSAYNRHMWDNVHAGLKLFSYHNLNAETLSDLPPDVSVRQAKEIIASAVNDAYGGQEFLELPAMHAGKISWEPATVKQVQIMHGIMFAPDWTFSNIRVAGRPIVNFRNRLILAKGIRYWRNMVITLAGSSILLQKMLYEIFKGEDPDLKEWTWQNEPGREWDVDITPIKRTIQKTLGLKVQERRSYAHAGKQAREVVRYFSDWPKGMIQNIGNKSSVLVRLVIEQVSGHQAGSGFPMPWMDSGFQEGLEGWKRVIAQGKAAGEHFIPFSWQASNFAFSVPHRKGMSRYRAARHYQGAMMAFADPSWWDKIKGKVSSDTQEEALIRFFREVDEALKANGQDDKSRKGTFNSARSHLRGRYYGKFFKAVDGQDWKAADDYAVILLNLGATGVTAKQSAERRGEKDLWSDEAKEIFKTRWELRKTFLNYKVIMRARNE